MSILKPTIHRRAPNRAEPKAPDVTAPALAIRIFDVLVPLCFIFFAWAHTRSLFQTLRVSNLVILAQMTLHLQFYVSRSTGPFVSTSAYAWLIALCGTVLPLMFRPTEEASDYPITLVVQVVALAMQIQVIRAMIRNPEAPVARYGIMREGLYRLVRHPVYLTLMMGQYAYLLNHTSIYNVCILAFATLFQVLRVNEEERLLFQDEEFQDYVDQTRWRVIPGVF
jgi:protein-S-isoprenylcysteine O-methyltransferase Ste14